MKAGTIRMFELEWRGGIADAANIRNAIRLQPRSRARQVARARRARIALLFTLAAALIVAAVAIGTGVTP